jgi:hypothetical protein
MRRVGAASAGCALWQISAQAAGNGGGEGHAVPLALHQHLSLQAFRNLRAEVVQQIFNSVAVAGGVAHAAHPVGDFLALCCGTGSACKGGWQIAPSLWLILLLQRVAGGGFA